MLSFVPWLVTLSRHKQGTFAVSGLLIALGFVNTYFIAPRLKTSDACEPGDIACGEASRLSKARALGIALALFDRLFRSVCASAGIGSP